MNRRADLLLGAAVLALGIVVVAGLGTIEPGAGYDRIGPRVFPGVVGLGLLLAGGSLVSPHLRRRVDRPRPDAAPPAPADWRALAYLALAMASVVVLLHRAGFIAAASLQFWLVTRAFDSPRPGRDAIISVLLAAAVFFAFSRGLGLELPAGPLEGWADPRS